MIKLIDKNAIRVHRHERIRNKISGTGSTPRLCVFRSNKHISAQIIDDEKKITLASASSVALKLENGSNIEAAKKVGEALGKVAIEKGIISVVFDRSGYVYHGRVAALADGAREAGLKF